MSGRWSDLGRMNIKTGPRSRVQVYSQAVTSTIVLQRGQSLLYTLNSLETDRGSSTKRFDRRRRERGRNYPYESHRVTHFFEVTLSGPFVLPLTVEVATIG